MAWYMGDLALLLACIGTAALTGAVWLGVLLLVDPHRREKGSTKDILLSFVLGCVSIPLSFLLYRFAPDLAWGIESPMGQEAALQLLVVGPVEEFSKFFIFFLIMQRRRPVQEPLDAMLHAAAVALAFSLVENVLYGTTYGVELTAFRAAVSTPGHLICASIWGFAYAVLIHGNPRRRPRDYVILFFSIYPAAALHGLSNLLLMLIDRWALLTDAVQLAAAAGLLAWLQRRSPFRPFRLSNAGEAIPRIDLSLASNRRSFPLNLRAALARSAAGDLGRARAHIDCCLEIHGDRAFALALSGIIYFLQGDADRGEQQLSRSYPSLGARQRLTVNRLVLHIVRRHGTDNAYNEFLLTSWLKSHWRH